MIKMKTGLMALAAAGLMMAVGCELTAEQKAEIKAKAEAAVKEKLLPKGEAEADQWLQEQVAGEKMTAAEAVLLKQIYNQLKTKAAAKIENSTATDSAVTNQ